MSKSHLHRLMIADFLASWQNSGLRNPSFAFMRELTAEDILATDACLNALRDGQTPVLECRESGSTLRFLMPVATALRGEVIFTAEGRLPQRPVAPFLDLLSGHGVECLSADKKAPFPLHLRGTLQPGDFVLPGNISSQIVTGLLMALPVLPGASAIRLISPLESGGYVEMTLQVLRSYGITVEENGQCFQIPGNQRYRAPKDISPEPDWSGAAFWIVMNRMGSDITFPRLPEESRQPDRRITRLLDRIGTSIDMSQCPDIFPVLAVAAAAAPAKTVFTGVRRLRPKESDRLAAMEELLGKFGIAVANDENSFTVRGTGPHFRGDVTVETHNDHRIAMSAAVAATVADGPVTVKNPGCVRKSYPDFFEQFRRLEFR